MVIPSWLLPLLVVATALFVSGVWIGVVFARRQRPMADSLDRQQYLTIIRSMANWTSEFAGDVSKVQSQLNGMSKQLGDAESPGLEHDVGRILQQMIDSNEQLQSRLNSAEYRLERQTHQLAGYLTEARTDGLTGLANRRAFDMRLDQRYRAHQQSGRPFVIVLIDLDHFKRVNDSLGHIVGDKVLKQFSDRLQQHFRESFLVARYGGEEFAVILGQPFDQATEMVERFRQQLEQNPMFVDGIKCHMTLSCGLAEIKNGETSDACVQRADEALYAAKAQGRNRTCHHDGNTTNLFRLSSAHTDSDAPDNETSGPSNLERDVRRDRMQHRLESHLNVESKSR